MTRVQFGDAVTPHLLPHGGRYHHTSGGVDWLVDIATRFVICSPVGQSPRSLMPTEALAVAYQAHNGRRT